MLKMLPEMFFFKLNQHKVFLIASFNIIICDFDNRNGIRNNFNLFEMQNCIFSIKNPPKNFKPL